MRNGWIIKHCYYDNLGVISKSYYTLCVEAKSFLGFKRKKELQEYKYHPMGGGGYVAVEFQNEEKAEEYLTAYLINKNPIRQWTKEIVKTITI